MGGDLIEGSQDPESPIHHKKWFEHMSRNLAQTSSMAIGHAYWNYDEVARFKSGSRHPEDRRRPEESQAAVHHRVRGARQEPATEHGGRPRRLPAGRHEDQRCGRRTSARFEHAWFQIRAAQLGYAGTIKWDCFFGRYDGGKQAYYAIGAPGPGAEGMEALPDLLPAAALYADDRSRVAGTRHQERRRETQEASGGFRRSGRWSWRSWGSTRAARS